MSTTGATMGKRQIARNTTRAVQAATEPAPATTMSLSPTRYGMMDEKSTAASARPAPNASPGPRWRCFFAGSSSAAGLSRRLRRPREATTTAATRSMTADVVTGLELEAQPQRQDDDAEGDEGGGEPRR